MRGEFSGGIVRDHSRISAIKVMGYQAHDNSANTPRIKRIWHSIAFFATVDVLMILGGVIAKHCRDTDNDNHQDKIYQEFFCFHVHENTSGKYHQETHDNDEAGNCDNGR